MQIVIVTIMFMTLIATDAGAPADRFEVEISALEKDVREAVGASGRVSREAAVVRVELDVRVAVPNAEKAANESKTVALISTATPYLDDREQRALLAEAQKTERALWKRVKNLECEGKNFADRYQGGLCFRPLTATQRTHVGAYRQARSAWLGVPRYHRGSSLSIAFRLSDGEPPDGSCGAPCSELFAHIAARLTAYPDEQN